MIRILRQLWDAMVSAQALTYATWVAPGRPYVFSTQCRCLPQFGSVALTGGHWEFKMGGRAGLVYHHVLELQVKVGHAEAV